MLFNRNTKNKIQQSLGTAKDAFAKSDQTAKDKLLFAFNVTFDVLKSLVYFIVVVFLFLGALGGGIGIGYFAYLVSDTPVPDKQELQNKINDVEQLSTITYAGGEKIADIRSDLIRTNVASDQISPLVKKALISTEDEYFDVHKGIVPKAVIRALVSDATGLGGSSGGSTITQQLVKQQVLTSETSYKRKANEIVLAMRVENFFSKDEIITSYLNVSPFGRNNKGQNIAGVQEAAKGIFNTTADKLNLPQAAFIAGLPQSPISYSPYLNTGELREDQSLGLERKDQVLYNMYKEGYITKQEYDDAKNYDLTQDFKPSEDVTDNVNGYLYDYTYDQAIKILMPIYYEADGLKTEDLTNNDKLSSKYYDIAARELRRNGYTVQTTIDKTVYEAMQNATANYAGMFIGDYGIETSSVLLDNQTGRIISFVAGRDFNQNKNNHAFTTRRSPGSTIKPILAYAPAIDAGLIGSESKLSNFSRKYKGDDSDKDLMNYSRQPSTGFESARQALKMSDNVPAVELYLELLKVADPKEYYDKMNMTMTDSDFYGVESIAVGGTTKGPTNLEQTNAFATLANKGNYSQGYSIEKITDNNGNIIYQHEVEPISVFSPATASIMNDMMRDVITSGTGTMSKNTLASMGSGLTNADWVGKTGTSENNGDYWFIASTPKVSLSNWIGYSDAVIPMDAAYGQNNMQLWAYIANAAYEANPALFGITERFTLDPSVIHAEVSDFSGQKLGTAMVEGSTWTVPGKKIESLWAKNGPSATQFRFGMGATDAQYLKTWNDSYVKPKVPAKTTPSSSTNRTNSTVTNNVTEKKDDEDD